MTTTSRTGGNRMALTKLPGIPSGHLSGAGGMRHPRYGEHAGTSVWGRAPGRSLPPAPATQSEAEVAVPATAAPPCGWHHTSASDPPVEAGATVTTPSGVSLGEGRPLLPPRPFRFHTDLRFPNDPDWLVDRARTTTITVKGDVL